MTIQWCPTCGGPLRPERPGVWWLVIDGCRLCWLLIREEDFRRLVRGAEWRDREAEANAYWPGDPGWAQWLPPGARWPVETWALHASDEERLKFWFWQSAGRRIMGVMG